MKRLRTPFSLQLTIDSLSTEGHGVGKIAYPIDHHSPAEVPFTLAGDVVNAHFIGKERGIYQGHLLDIIQPAVDRVAPRCIHFGDCGGCTWQQAAYSWQLQQKQLFIQQLLAPYSHSETRFHTIIGCEPPWYYRNKAELSFRQDRHGQQYVGFIRARTRGHVFNMQECHLVLPWFVYTAKAVHVWWEQAGLEAYQPRQDRGSLRTLTLREGRRTGDRLIMLTVSGNPDYAFHKQQLQNFIQTMIATATPSQAQLAIFLRIQQVAKGKKTQFYEMLLHGPDHIRETLYIHERPLHFKISPTAFFQPNTEQSEKLYRRALELAQLTSTDIVYDLYCGTGTLGICAARYVDQVIGIELIPEAVLDAKENVKQNHLENVTILKGDVKQTLKEVNVRPTVIMLDPPRAGLDRQTIQQLLDLKAPTLVYLSCNPKTQADNLKDLCSFGYQLTDIQPVDQFPHTTHVENIVILRLKS